MKRKVDKPMTKYDIIFEELQVKVESGELSFEDAEILNELAFEKFGDDETEYEAITEAYYDGHIKSTERDIDVIKKHTEKEVKAIDKEIEKLEQKKRKIEASLDTKLKPFEKKKEKYEQLNIEDPEGKRDKKRTLVAAGAIAGAAVATAAVDKIAKTAKTKKKKIEAPEKKEVKEDKTPDFKNSHR